MLPLLRACPSYMVQGYKTCASARKKATVEVSTVWITRELAGYRTVRERGCPPLAPLAW